jgi:hypothetical protein
LKQEITLKNSSPTHYFFEGDGSVATLTGNAIQNTIPGNDDVYLQTAANCVTVNFTENTIPLLLQML